MIILLIIIVALLIPYCVDIYIHSMSIVKRIGIGRYNNLAEWEKKVSIVAKRWISKSPTVKKTDNDNFLIKDIIKGNYTNATIQSWQTALVYLAIAEQEGNTDFLNEFINKEGKWRKKPANVDFSLLAYAILKDAHQLRPRNDS